MSLRRPMFSFGSKKDERRRKVRLWAAERRPRLERLNASNNIDYEASWPSTSSDEALSLRTTRSLDLSPTSFRISGSIEGEFEHLCHSLGLSGPEDFAISDAVWEASIRARSSSDLLPRSRLHSDSLLSQPENSTPASGLRAEETTEPAVPSEEIRVRDVETEEISHSFANESGGADGGIRGPRPPVFAPPLSLAEVLSPPSAVSVLAPPPSTALLVDDRPSNTWDLVRSFAPLEENEEVAERSSLDSDEDEEKRAESGGDGKFLEERGTVVGVVSENGAGSSNDEDSSNTTTELIISPSGRFKKKIRSWMRGQLIGSGSFGTVYEGISDDGTFIAVKEVSLMDKGSSAQQCIVQLEQEIALLSQFEHENVVQYYGTDKEESKLFIFLELATQGSLASLYKKYHLRDTQVSAYTRQILDGLNYLHVQSVVHRDIKCANILVHANGSVKLADFGLAKEISKFNDLKSCKGSVYWMAPEVVNPRKTYGRAADIWSLGCTVLEMLSRQIPFPNVEWQHAFYKIGRGEQPPIPSHLSSDARDFIRQCVQVDPNSRPTAAELLEHPFVRRPLET